VELNFYTGYGLTYEIEVWQRYRHFPEGVLYELKWPRHIVSPGPGPSRTLAKFTGSEDDLVLVVFNYAPTGPIDFQGDNGWYGAPSIEVAQGAWSRKGVVNRGVKYIFHNMDVGERVNVPGFYIDRSPDSPNPWIADWRLARERPLDLGKLIPVRVRRALSALLPVVGTPASAPKPCGRSWGQPKGSYSGHAIRSPSLKKAAYYALLDGPTLRMPAQLSAGAAPAAVTSQA
jgi:hypothetical protein